MQTTRDNVAREYCQHLFLSRFYQQRNAEKILFKGGTALRLLWQSPRFSEDLDFSGVKVPPSDIENILETVLVEIEREGLDVDIRESKKTTGGYLGEILFRWAGFSVSIQIQISQRQSLLNSEKSIVQSDLLPPYAIFHLAEKDMVQEKITALLERGKPRDFFDLYFILRSRRSFHPSFRKDKHLKEKILEKLRTISGNPLLGELKKFLPASHHLLLKDFPSVLKKEINRAIPSE